MYIYSYLHIQICMYIYLWKADRVCSFCRLIQTGSFQIIQKRLKDAEFIPIVKHITSLFVLFLHPRLQFRHWKTDMHREMMNAENAKSTLVSFFFDVIFAIATRFGTYIFSKTCTGRQWR